MGLRNDLVIRRDLMDAIELLNKLLEKEAKSPGFITEDVIAKRLRKGRVEALESVLEEYQSLKQEQREQEDKKEDQEEEISSVPEPRLRDIVERKLHELDDEVESSTYSLITRVKEFEQTWNCIFEEEPGVRALHQLQGETTAPEAPTTSSSSPLQRTFSGA